MINIMDNSRTEVISRNIHVINLAKKPNQSFVFYWFVTVILRMTSGVTQSKRVLKQALQTRTIVVMRVWEESTEPRRASSGRCHPNTSRFCHYYCCTHHMLQSCKMILLFCWQLKDVLDTARSVFIY